MRIAAPKRQGVQSLGRHSVGNTGFEGDAELTRAVTGVASGLATQYAELRTHRQIQNAGLAAQKAQTQFDDHMIEQMGDEPFFDVNDLPSDIVTQSMRDRVDGRVMRAEVEPAMYKKHMETSLAEISKGIELAGARADWQSKARTNGLAHYTSLQAKAQTEIKSQFFEAQKADWRLATDNGDWGIALEIADGMYGTESEKNVYRQLAKQGAEHKEIGNIGVRKDPIEIKDTIIALSQEEKVYKKGGGSLNIDQRISEMNYLNGVLSKLNSEKEAGLKVQLAELKHKISTVKSNTAAGKQTSRETMQDIHAEINAFQEVLGGDTLVGEQLDLEDQINVSLRVNETLLKPHSERVTDAMVQPYLIYPNDEVRRTNMQHQMETAVENMRTAELNDPMQARIDAGWYGEQGLPPVNLKDPASVAHRVKMFKGGQAHSGEEHIGNGPFTTQEAEVHGLELNEAKPKEQFEMALSIVHGAGPDANAVFQQLASDGDAGSLSIAGVNLYHGNETAARFIIEGREFRKNQKELISEFQLDSDLKSRISAELPNLYWHNGDKKQVINDTIFDAYVGIKAQSGDFKTFDEKAYEKAVRYATGGIFEIGGQQLPNAIWGQADGVMNKWFEEVSPEYILETSGPIIVEGQLGRQDPAVFMERVNSGYYKLGVSHDTKAYTVMDESGVLIKAADGKSNFLIWHDAAAQKKPETSIFNTPIAGPTGRQRSSRLPGGNVN